MATVVFGAFISHSVSANSGAPGARLLGGQIVVRDYADGGNMVLTGTVTVLNVPAARKVRLFDHYSGRIVRETWSDPVTGEYTFEYIRDGSYTVLAYDHTGTYDPEAKTQLTPVPMQ